MKKNIIVLIIIVLAVLIVGIYLVSAMGGSSKTTKQNENANTAGPITNSYRVEISNSNFTPSELRIKAGDNVIWTNKDSMPHTVTGDSSNEFNSQILEQERSYSHTFNSPGEYSYHCAIHPLMIGKIIVE
ncbi:MAG: hypothetical protein COY66_06490 [Candidatus Kerfeldbacteria bacterium CG_4_10_14_0_8_um_filter_42_10]|uniref:Blue (type 1) copper domain-containing protein n=1 Tax=Candidatus Kerfeldbacteria bacterium CG_4_10_14_0_8_um_filter_42_10 TaxID=2014248 RepID=A0A2M7RGV7_9BACT|nr:MAG: hypothetical protein COY66_06490 [Candidatus Kerfeldbacteria bacterium CG_4_10_14_0_8_um_filter_42_10]